MASNKKAWFRKVIDSSGGVCKVCGEPSNELEAHHLYSEDLFPEYSISDWNGVALCKKCHADFHSHYGKSVCEQDFAKYFTARKTPVKEV